MNAYHYAILRYRHSIVEGEFANIGVVIWLMGESQLLATVNERYHRLSEFFPSFDSDGYKQAIRAIKGRMDTFMRAYNDTQLVLESRSMNFKELLHDMWPAEDSCFQWSDVRGGITDSPIQTLADLMEDMVFRNEKRAAREREDETKIWRRVDEALERWDLKLPPRELETPDVKYRFKASWNNGCTQVLEPVSFDLLNKADLKDKGLLWKARLATLFEQHNFKATLVLSPPAAESLQKDFRQVKIMLGKLEMVRKVVDEEHLEDIIPEIQQDIETHEQRVMV